MKGLDYQFCDCIVNYDLPWNPMKIEQRIGRIDRRGQKSESVAIINLDYTLVLSMLISINAAYFASVCSRARLEAREEILGEITTELRDIVENHELTPELNVERSWR